MEDELLTLSTANELEKLRNLVTDLQEDEMMKMIKNKLSARDQEFIKLIVALFKGLKESSLPPSQLSSSFSLSSNNQQTYLFTTCVEILAKYDINTKLTTDLIRLLIVEMDALPSHFLIKLSKQIIRYLGDAETNNFRYLEVLPKLMHLVRSKDSIPTDVGSTNGVEVQSSLVNNICSMKWNSNSVVHLASIFKEIQLSPDELRSVFIKCLKALDSIDLQEIPPLVYQLLILSSKGCKILLLDGIISYFYKKNKPGQPRDKNGPSTLLDDIDLIEGSTSSVRSQLRQIEGTVVYHVTFSINQNHNLGKEFLKYLKANQSSDSMKMMSSLVISLALSISKISAFESQVLELLKQSTMYRYRDQKKKSESKWLRENSASTFDVADCTMESVKQMLINWDVVMEGVVAFSFSLMEVSATRNAFGRQTHVARVASNASVHLTPAQNLNILGANILEQCSKVHSNVAMEIVDQLANRIVTKGHGFVPYHFIDLFITLLKTSPHTYVENSQKFKDMFDIFPFLHLGTCRVLLKALLPVVRISPALKNGLILFLRKSLFSRQLEMRKMAVCGFLLLLKNFKVLAGFGSSQSQSSSSSQVTVDFHRRSDDRRLNDVDNKSLCLEILNNLRRSFSQQPDVRSLLYNGLYDVLTNNTFLAGPIANLLLTQLKTYFDPNDSNLPPLRTTSCISLHCQLWIISEPLPDLVDSLVRCMDHLKNKTTKDDEEEVFVKKTNEILDSVATRIARCDIEDFELDKGIEFDANTNTGSKNVSLASLASGLCEVFMQREISYRDTEQLRVENMLKIFQVYSQIADTFQEGEPARKGKSKKVNLPLDPQKSNPIALGRYVSLDFVVKVASMMFESDEAVANLMLSNNNFLQYFFNSATALLQQFTTTGIGGLEFQISGRADARDPEVIVGDLFEFARLLFKRYLKVAVRPQNKDISISASTTNNPNKNNNQTTKQLNSNCLKLFCQIMSFFSKKCTNRMTEFLLKLDILGKLSKKSLNKDRADPLERHIKMFQRIFFTILTSAEEWAAPKDRLLVMQCIAALIESFHDEKRNEVLVECCSWFLRMFKEHVIDDSELLKLMLQQLLTLLRKTDVTFDFLGDVCRDVHLCLGDINPQLELDKSNNLPTVNHRSSAAIIQSVLSHLELEIEDSDWLIGRLKSNLAGIALSSSADEGVAEEGCSTDMADANAPNAGDSDRVLPMKDVSKSLIGRLSSMTELFHELVQTSVPFGPLTEHLLRVLSKFYTSLSSTVKLYVWKFNNKSVEVDMRVSGPFEKLVKLTATQLTKFIYPMINHIETLENERLQAANDKGKKKKNKNKDAPAVKVKRIKETKFIPALIMNMEQYERLLIQLSKKSMVDLMASFKVSTSRDFRINNATLQEILDNRRGDAASDDDGSDNDDDDDDDNEVGGSVSRHSKSNSYRVANDDDDDDDDDDVGSILRTENDGANEIERSREDEGEVSAPPRKRPKLKDILPRDNKKLPNKFKRKSK